MNEKTTTHKNQDQGGTPEAETRLSLLPFYLVRQLVPAGELLGPRSNEGWWVRRPLEWNYPARAGPRPPPSCSPPGEEECGFRLSETVTLRSPGRQEVC
jgi:hypothetical protein